MDSLAYLLDFNDETNSRERRKVVRNNIENVLQQPNASFLKQFRLNKPAFEYVLGILKTNLPAVRKSALSPELKLSATLRFLAEGGYQNGVGKDYEVGMAQSTVSVVLAEVLNILENHLCPLWINMIMPEEEKREARRYFYEKSRMPGVVMCVDGTHIKIAKPHGDNAHLFYNRKGFYSINAMIICDHKQRIRFIDAKYPGATHDSLIWGNSDANNYLQSLYDSGDRNTRLLGDGGYPLSPWLLTPFRNAAYNSPESRFNTNLGKGRNIVERTIGLWKNWCRCLLGARQLHYAPEKCAQIINVCAALHNIRIYFNVSDEEPIIEPSLSLDEEDGHDSTPSIYTQLGGELRNYILQNFRQ